MIRFDTSSGRLATQNADCLAVGLFDEERLQGAARELDVASRGQLRRLRAEGDISSKPGDVQMLLQLPGVRARRVVVVGLGRRADFNRRAWRKAVGAALAACLKGRSAHLALAIDRPDEKQLDDYYLGRAVADLSLASLYRVNDFKSGRRPRPHALKRVTLAGIAAGAPRCRPARAWCMARASARARRCCATWATCQAMYARRATWPTRRAPSHARTARCAYACSTRRRSAG